MVSLGDFTRKVTPTLSSMALLSYRQCAMEGVGGWVNFNYYPLYSATDIDFLFSSSWSKNSDHDEDFHEMDVCHSRDRFKSLTAR